VQAGQLSQVQQPCDPEEHDMVDQVRPALSHLEAEYYVNQLDELTPE
jgi:hypothetical protein